MKTTTRHLATFTLFLAFPLFLHATALPPQPETRAASPAAAPVAPATLEGRVYDTAAQRYLTNARITIEGTQFQSLTNALGDYRITGIPPGQYILTAFFTGLPAQQVKITLAPGQTLVQTFELSASSDIVQLDRFSVNARRESIDTIATNEQRFATNIKTVVDTDAFGDVTSGNVGDFLKYLPGVSVNYDGPDPSSAMVRGFGASYTAVTADGMSIANASGDNSQDSLATRTFQFDQMSLNNVSRIEVTKVPLPSMRADSMGGNVNMVSKNAFERRKTSLNFRTGADFNSGDHNFYKRTATPGQNGAYKLRPNFDFDLTLPVNKNFGIVLTGQHSDRFTNQRGSTYDWCFENIPGNDFNRYANHATTPDTVSAYYIYGSPNSKLYKPGYIPNYGLPGSMPPSTADTNTLSTWNPLYTSMPILNGAQYTNYLQTDPYLYRYLVVDQPKITTKNSLGLRADWRPTRNSTLSLTWQIGYTVINQMKNTLSWSTGYIHAFQLPALNGGLIPGINTKAELMSPDLAATNPQINPDAYKYFRQWGYDPAYGGYYSISPQNTTTGGQARTQQNLRTIDRYGLTNALNLKYNYTGPEWTFDTALNYSRAKSWQRDTQNGHFGTVITANTERVQSILIGGIQTQNAPTMLRAYNMDGTIMDTTNLDNTVINTVITNPIDSTDTFKTLQANLQRTLNALPFYATLKTGFDIRSQERDTVKTQQRWYYSPPDSNNPIPASTYMDIPYSTRPQAWGLPSIAIPSTYLVYQAFLADLAANPTAPLPPDLATPYPQSAYYNYYQANLITTNPTYKNNDGYRRYWEYKFANDYYLQETISALYVQFDAKFLDNRLSLTTGFRYEMTNDRGQSALMPAFKIPDPNNPGTYFSDEILNDNNQTAYVRDYFERAKGEFMAKNWIARAKHSYKSYGDIYPSLHLNYNITANMIARFAYAKTLGRPDFTNIIPIARYNDRVDNSTNDPYTLITTSNPALKPYRADNFDLSLEYYFKNGGLASVSAFYKNIKNPFGTIQIDGSPTLLAEMGISDTYINPVLVAPINLDGRLTTKGVELNLRTPLAFIPHIGRYLSVTGNATIMDIRAPYNATLDGFVKQSASWGVNIITSRLILRLNWNYRGRQKTMALMSFQYQPLDTSQRARPEDFQGFYEYISPRLTLDANLEYRITKLLNLFINARNLTNSRMVWQRYNDLTPEYAKTYYTEQYGSQIAFGIKGSF